MPLVNVKYFALLKEKAQLDSEQIEFAGSYGELYTHLSSLHHFNLPLEMIQVAVNDEFSTMSNLVEESAKVVFIPPVAGG